MGQKSSRLRVSDVEERLLDPVQNPTDVENEGTSAEPKLLPEKSHSSVGRLLSLGMYVITFFETIDS